MLEVLLPLGIATAVAIGQYISDKKTEEEFYRACGENSWVGKNLPSSLEGSKVNL